MSAKLPKESEIVACIEEMRSNSALGNGDDVLLMDYQNKYLESKPWKKIKRRVLKRDKNICLRCGGKGTVVHHRSYEREVLEGDADHLLATVCSACHEVIHFDDKGRKRSFEEWEIVLQQFPDPHDYPEPEIDLRRDPLKDWPPQRSRMTEAQL